MNIALVTGASSGFGKAICRKLITDGYKVIGAARRLDKLQKLAQELGDNFLPLTTSCGIRKLLHSVMMNIE